MLLYLSTWKIFTVSKVKNKKKNKQNKIKHKESSVGPAVPSALGSQASPSLGSECQGCIAPGSGSAEVLKGPAQHGIRSAFGWSGWWEQGGSSQVEGGGETISAA